VVEKVGSTRLEKHIRTDYVMFFWEQVHPTRNARAKARK